MASNVYDAIIIGGGHNGLVSGAYFAREGARTVVLEARDKTGGAADTSAPFADHPDINVTTYSYVMSLMPPTIIRELRLKQFGYDVTPFGPYFQAYPDGRAVTRLPGRRRAVLRLDRAVLEEGRRHPAEVGGVAAAGGRHPRADHAPRTSEGGFALAGRPAPADGDRVEDAQARRPRGRGRDAAVHDEHHGPAERLVRVRRGQGHAHGQRRDRHVGRAGRAGYRLRDAAPLDRRRRRRPPRQLGLSSRAGWAASPTRSARPRRRSAARSAPARA